MQFPAFGNPAIVKDFHKYDNFDIISPSAKPIYAAINRGVDDNKTL